MMDLSHLAALSTALELEIFEVLKDDFLSLQEIKSKCGIKIPNRNLSDFMDKLFVHNHLIREGVLESAKYKISDDLFIKSNPNNIIPLVNMMKRISKRYESLPEIMRTGKFPNKKDIFNELYSDAESTHSFLRTMAMIQSENFKILAKDFDFSNYNTCLDVGGCLGAFSIEMKTYNEHLDVFTYDLAIIEKYVKEFLDEKNMLEKVNVLNGDMFKDDFPKTDIIAMGNILHDWNLEKKLFLLKKAFESLNANGICVVIESFIDDERLDNSFGINSSFNMLVECLDGYNMSKIDLEGYAKETGFYKVEFLRESHGIEVAILRK